MTTVSGTTNNGERSIHKYVSNLVHDTGSRGRFFAWQRTDPMILESGRRIWALIALKPFENAVFREKIRTFAA